MPDLRDDLCRAIEKVRQASSDFDLNPTVVLPEHRVLKPSAVLMAVTMGGDVILTKRSSHLKNHPGQIAFPGGRQDDTDDDLIATALREAKEEVSLDPADVDVLGLLPPHETVTQYAVTPVIAIIPDDRRFTPEPGEVSEVFQVPLTHLVQAGSFRVEGRRWQGQRRNYYTVPYGPYYIWGATARILRSLAEAWP
ncbi:MAG: CoA pyrophosphatase [Pseudomonadota bacterium]